MVQNQALCDIKLSWKVKTKIFFQILWFLTNEMPVFVLHISSFHLSNVKSEQEKEEEKNSKTQHCSWKTHWKIK